MPPSLGEPVTLDRAPFVWPVDTQCLDRVVVINSANELADVACKCAQPVATIDWTTRSIVVLTMHANITARHAGRTTGALTIELSTGCTGARLSSVFMVPKVTAVPPTVQARATAVTSRSPRSSLDAASRPWQKAIAT